VPDRSAWRADGFVWAMTLACLATGTGTAAAQLDAEGLSSRFRQASKQTLPAVVTVRPLGVASPFDGGPAAIDAPARSVREGGSGVVVDAGRGLVATNDHVIAGATRGVVVILGNGRERPVSQVWRDPKSDLALLAIDPNGLVAAPWGDSTKLAIGDWVLAIGGPFGLSGTVTAGIVSGKGRGIGMALYEDLIQTDAAINPGNSGGPLINLQGEVVGINTALKSNGGGYEGVGFAVPASRARRVVADLAEFGRVRRAYLGINIRPLDPATAARLNIAEGSLVSSVTVAGPAALAGLQPGDVVLSIGGQPVGGAGALQAAIEVARVGEPLDLTVDRNGQVFPVQVRPEPQPDRYGLPTATMVFPVEPVVGMVRRPGLHINVPGANLVVPGPNLNITPYGVTRAPRAVIVPGPVAGPLILAPTPGQAPNPEVGPEPVLTPINPAPATTIPPQSGPVETSSRSANFPTLGLNLAEPTPVLVERYRLPRDVSGLVITGVDADSPADRGGLEPGMVVTDAAGKGVGNVEDFRRVFVGRPPGRDLLIRIKRGSKAEFRVIVAPAADQLKEPAEPALEPLPPPTPRPL